MSKYLVDLYSEDAFEAIGSFNINDLSEMRESIQHAEDMTGKEADFVLVYNEHDETSNWFVLDENVKLYEADEDLSEALDEEFGDDLSELFEAESGWFEDLLMEELDSLNEALQKRVSSTGSIKRIKSRKIRRRNAARTTGMSKSKLKRRARKSARTKRRNPGGQRRALRKRRKALRKRRQMGIKRGG